MTHWYRYDDCATGGGIDVRLSEIPVVKETPKGVWLYAARPGSGRFVLRGSRKRWACPTIGEAKESFLARKRRQVKLLRGQLQQAEAALSIAEGDKVPPVPYAALVEFDF